MMTCVAAVETDSIVNSGGKYSFREKRAESAYVHSSSVSTGANPSSSGVFEGCMCNNPPANTTEQQESVLD
jgi:hypothetical protein